ncbi:type 2A phosphatase activator Tip41p [[Candida] jaroonii]|uniref:Type 2A phosphatase activator Tip41p n=1 Tax=[Candida] jaroonii TaxID=467808 RepID=A0ACA9Y036_9ASCO|nr:type 2A phosphatase activator Tip41p [[Candida] jaroonii]
MSDLPSQEPEKAGSRQKSSVNKTNEAFVSTVRNAPNKTTGIDAVHINAAREMVKLHTRDRLPTNSVNNRINTIPKPLPRPSNNPHSTQLPQSSFATPRPSASLKNIKMSIPAKGHEGPCTNPQCAHCGTVIIPAPKSSFPIMDKPSITINDWSIYTIKRPILSSQELDDLESRYDFPLPEMIFGNNKVRLVSDQFGTIEFNGLDALDSLNKESDFKVSYHREWLEARKNKMLSESFDTSEKKSKEISNLDLSKITDIETIKNFDWTYSVNYKGSITGIEFKPTNDPFPIDRLLKPDPILFFDESVLFEDELGDNGISVLSTKIRVMPTCLLLLCRFFLKIDNVSLRIRDTRIFIDLETNKIFREYKCQDCEYDEVLSKINSKNLTDPKSLLRDSNWVANNIPVNSVTTETNM